MDITSERAGDFQANYVAPADVRNGGGRPLREHAGKIASNILDAAKREFAERGFHGSSIRQIASQAGVTRATVYHHFPTKDLMLSKASEISAKKLQMALEELIDHKADYKHVLFRVGRRLYNMGLSQEDRRLSRTLVAEAHRLPELVRNAHALRTQSLSPLAAYFDHLALKGTLTIDNSERTAAQFLHLVTGSVEYLFEVAQPPEPEQELWVLSAVNLFLNGVHNGNGAAPKVQNNVITECDAAPP